jgi:hypothetical protein
MTWSEAHSISKWFQPANEHYSPLVSRSTTGWIMIGTVFDELEAAAAREPRILPFRLIFAYFIKRLRLRVMIDHRPQ